MGRRPFYSSNAWLRARRACLAAALYRCERCGAPATMVHHRQPITDETEDDPDITLDPSNLEALCFQCHQLEHHGASPTVEGLAFDETGQLRRICLNCVKNSDNSDVEVPPPAEGVPAR